MVGTESIKAAIPGHPKRGSSDNRRRGGVYQSGDSRPSKAASPRWSEGSSSLSKRRFPAIQSSNLPWLKYEWSLSKRRFPAIQSASAADVATLFESIKAAIPGHPKLDSIDIPGMWGVYQSGDSRPSKAKAQVHNELKLSLSKRRFPAIQSEYGSTRRGMAESIKAAIPGHPKHIRRRAGRVQGVYQSGDSRPSKAHRPRAGAARQSLSKRRFPAIQSYEDTGRGNRIESIKAAIPGHPKQGLQRNSPPRRVYQSGDSRPSKAGNLQHVPEAWSLSKRRFPAIQSLVHDERQTLPSLSKRRFPAIQSLTVIVKR